LRRVIYNSPQTAYIVIYNSPQTAYIVIYNSPQSAFSIDRMYAQIVDA
jgi:hypothetical protein